MKLSNYDENQQDSLKQYFLQALNFYKQEEMMMVQSVYWMLILANGSAIFLLGAYLGALVSANKGTEGFGLPLFLFIVGLVSAGYIVQYSMGVTHTVITQTSQQVLRLFKDELDLDDFQAWGFSEKGLKIIGFAQLVSAFSFLLGVVIALLNI